MAAAKSLTPEQRSQRASFASHTSWARTDDRSARTAPARAASMGRFEREVDPGGVLTPDERAKRAENARRAYFQRLAYLSSRARQRRTPTSGAA
ncbi:hypothetical protein [Mycobacterium nebraskense]|uniref:hypothetical protein n=1 Tax=Mycobacterium nebraskense TaxID=244292 RepID=UPI0009E2CCDA|nr:hypothetical protein [Mycobacterium nebraskense]